MEKHQCPENLRVSLKSLLYLLGIKADVVVIDFVIQATQNLAVSITATESGISGRVPSPRCLQSLYPRPIAAMQIADSTAGWTLYPQLSTLIAAGQ